MLSYYYVKVRKHISLEDLYMASIHNESTDLLVKAVLSLNTE